MQGIDFLATEDHFAHHLRPVYRHLRNRGDFFTDPESHHNRSQHVVVASYGDVKRARQMGYTRIARMEHGAGQSYGTGHGSYAGGRDHDDVSLFLTPNRYSADLWQQAYPEARVEVVGCPKLDTLPRKESSSPPVVALSFHWDCGITRETQTAMQHYVSAFEELAQHYTVLGHAHPRMWGGAKRTYERYGIEPVKYFDEVCERADVYACDNSSTLFEFASTDRPVVVLNAPWYRKHVHHGLRFWDAADVGIQVDQPGQFLDAIGEAVEDPPARQRARDSALDIVYTYRSGAAERAARVLETWE